MNKPDDKRQNSKSQAKQGPMHGLVGANNIEFEAGMFLRDNIQGVGVDTGATLSLVSKEVARTIGKVSMHNLDTMCENVYDAGGKDLDVSGKGTFVLKIDSFSCTVQGAVADLMKNCVIGLDVMTGYNCSVDLRKQELAIGNFNEFQMVRKGHFGCLRVVTPSIIRKPAKPEAVVPEKVSTPKSEQQSCCKSIIEPIFDQTNDILAVVDRNSVTSTISAKKFLTNSAILNTQIRMANGAGKNRRSRPSYAQTET